MTTQDDVAELSRGLDQTARLMDDVPAERLGDRKPPDLAAVGRRLASLGVTGVTDATIEFAKGFAIWDLAPGHYILWSAGGTVIDLDGKSLPLDHRLESMTGIAAAMDRRQKFIAASTPELAHGILEVLELPG